MPFKNIFYSDTATLKGKNREHILSFNSSPNLRCGFLKTDSTVQMLVYLNTDIYLTHILCVQLLLIKTIFHSPIVWRFLLLPLIAPNKKKRQILSVFQ